MNHKSISIYQDNNPGSARSIYLTLTDGILSMELQDVGSLVERFCGNSVYQRFLNHISVEDVMRVLGVKSEDELIDALKESFGTQSGLYDFKDFLKRNDIKFTSGSY